MSIDIMPKFPMLKWLGLSLLAVLLDQITKLWVAHDMQLSCVGVADVVG